MSPSEGPHHKILNEPRSRLRVSTIAASSSQRPREDGYTLVALLALMTIFAILAAAAAPNLRRQAQRENEVEAIFRGEQVAEAIRLYLLAQQRKGLANDAALPTSIDQLMEGVSVGTKKLQILRPSAARDPLTADGEWRLIKPRSSDMSAFTQSIMVFNENIRPGTGDTQLQQIEQFMAPAVISTLGIAATPPSSSDLSNSSGPFIGVSSNSKSNAIIYYYGIDRHDGWVFTPLFR